jgi:hypothetical protein
MHAFEAGRPDQGGTTAEAHVDGQGLHAVGPVKRLGGRE